MGINERKLVSPFKVIIRVFVALLLIAIQILIYWWLFVGTLQIPYIYLISFIVSIILVIRLYNSNDNISYKILWIIIILLFNVSGPIFYLCFGNGNNLPKRKRKKINGYLHNEIKESNILDEIKEKDNLSYRISNFLHSVTGFYPAHNQGEFFYRDGKELFVKMIEAIDKAEKYIFLEYFIVASGEMFDELLEHLELAAKRKVEIKFIYDYVGCNVPKVLKRKDLKRLKEIEGIKVASYNPPGITLNLGINYRDHRKILLIDGKVSFVGGINIADEYIALKERFGIWRDNGMMVTGEACHNYLILFAASWYMSTGEKLSVDKYTSTEKFKVEPGYIFSFGDGPHNKLNPTYDLYVKLIENAKKSIYISTPYFIIDNVFLKSLINQIKSGIEVIILIPEIPDKKMTYLMSEENALKIVNAGGKVYRYSGGFNHAKTLIVDSEYAVVGTINIDYRSMFLHYECGNLLMKTPLIKEIEKDFMEDIAFSKEMISEEKRNPFKKILSFFLSIFGPLF